MTSRAGNAILRANNGVQAACFAGRPGCRLFIFRPAGQKVPGQTAVPAGVYEAVLTLSPRFKRVLPLLLDVPGFEGILIHRGNTAKDTAGCILLGENREPGKVVNSGHYEIMLTQQLKEAQANGEEIWIEIE